MFGNLNGWHLLILLAVILLLFGAAKLPALAKSVGQSARVFRGEMKAMKEEEGEKPTPVDGTVTSAAAETSAPAPATSTPADTPESKQ
jgi:sec-independent protein translocase protein TatA